MAKDLPDALKQFTFHYELIITKKQLIMYLVIIDLHFTMN